MVLTAILYAPIEVLVQGHAIALGVQNQYSEICCKIPQRKVTT